MLALLACAQIAGAAPLLKPATMLLIGEMHGSREIPRAVEALACMARERRVPVTVALEISDGPDFWTRSYQDGRSSAAMAALVKSGFPVVGFDRQPVDQKLRDAQMADKLLELRKARPRDLILVLSGNLHNRISIGVPWDAQYRPMAWHLLQHGVRLTSLEATYAGGETWMCDEKGACGPHRLKGDDRGEAPAVRLKPAPDTVHGTLYVGALSASPPARSEKAQ